MGITLVGFIGADSGNQLVTRDPELYIDLLW